MRITETEGYREDVIKRGKLTCPAKIVISAFRSGNSFADLYRDRVVRIVRRNETVQ